MNAAKDKPIEMSSLPPMLQRLAELIGTDKTLLLADSFGGLERLYIPHEATTGHLWCSVLTVGEWQKVVAAMGGERVDLPRGVFVELKKVAINELADKGMRHRQIALRVRCSERYVRGVLKGMPTPDDDRQVKLFK